MASKVAEAYLVLRASMDQFAADMKIAEGASVNATEKTGKAMNEGMKKHGGEMSKTAGGAFGEVANQARSLATILATVLGGAFVLGSAKDMEMAQVRIKTSLQATGNAAGWSAAQLTAMGKQLGLSATYGTTATMGAMSAMLQFRDVQGEVFKQAMAMAGGLAAVTGGDLKRAAEEMGAALQDPTSGLQKMASMGILFTLAERRMMDQLVATNQILSAQQFLLQKMAGADMQNWASAVNGTFAGAMMQMRAALTDLAAALGRFFLPILTPIVRLVTSIGEALTAAEPIWKGWSDRLSVAFGKIVTALQPAITAISGAFTASLRTVGDVIVRVVEAVATFIVNNQKMINSLIMAVGIYIGYRIAVIALAGAFGILKAAFWIFMSEFSGIIFKLAESEGFWKEWWHTIQDIFVGLGNDFMIFVGLFTGESSKSAKTVEEVFHACFHAIFEFISGVLDGLSSLVNDFGLNWDIMCQGSKIAAMTTWEGMKSVFSTTMEYISGGAYVLGNVFSNVWQNIRAGWDTLCNAIRAGLSGIWAGITAIFSGKNPLTAFVSEFHKQFSELGKNSAQWKNVAEGSKKAFNSAFKGGVGEEFSKELLDEGTKLNDLIRKREEGIRARKKAREAGEAGDRKKTEVKIDETGQPTPAGIATREIKLTFSGLTELWKKIQESMTGGSMIALTKAGVVATEKNGVMIGDGNMKLDQIVKNTAGDKPAVAG
jgi:hypothetical protein